MNMQSSNGWRTFQRLVASLVLTWVSSLQTRGAVIFDNGSPVAGDAGGFSDPDASQILADDFTLTTSDTLRAITVYGQYFPDDTLPPADNFSVQFYDDQNGSPNQVAFASSDLNVISRVDTGLISFNNLRTFRYELDLATPQAFPLNTPTWISIVNDTRGGVDPDDDWLWSFRFNAGDGHFINDFQPNWVSDGHASHFQLHDTFFLRCDFDGDAACDITDLNALLAVGPVAMGVSATGNQDFDLTGDGMINNVDVDEWLAMAASANGFSSPYRRGDADLDGTVDGRDFVSWNSGKFTASLQWNRGDFNGDGAVTGQDFILWNENKFTSSDGGSSVPEPSEGVCLIAALIGVAVFRPRPLPMPES